MLSNRTSHTQKHLCFSRTEARLRMTNNFSDRYLSHGRSSALSHEEERELVFFVTLFPPMIDSIIVIKFLYGGKAFEC